MTEIRNRLRAKDEAVLRAIKDGNNDIQQVTEATTLENHEANYCFTKLEKLGLIHIEKQDGYTTRIINGQKRTFKAPKQAHLTEIGRTLDLNEEDLDQYQNLNHSELVERVYLLESEIEELERSFEVFRRQVLHRLE